MTLLSTQKILRNLQKRKEKNQIPITSKFSKVTEYKINIQKLIVFLYTTNEQGDTETKTTV